MVIRAARLEAAGKGGKMGRLKGFGAIKLTFNRTLGKIAKIRQMRNIGKKIKI